MNEYFIVYLIVLILNVPKSAMVLTCIAAGALVIAIPHDFDDDTSANWEVWLRRWCVLATLSTLTLFLIPTKTEMLYIVGGGAAINAAKNEEVRELPSNLANALNTFLKDHATVQGE